MSHFSCRAVREVSPATSRFSDIGLVTHARPRHKWAYITPKGVIHRVDSAIVRWDIRDAKGNPEVTFVLGCSGRQPRLLFPVKHPIKERLCRRCVGAMRRTEERRAVVAARKNFEISCDD